MNVQGNVAKHLGWQIRTLRQARGWSRSQLAELASLGERTIQRIESSGQASLESRMAIAQAFDMTADQLIQGGASHENQMNTTGRSGLRIASGLGLMASVVMMLVFTLFGDPSTAEPLHLEVSLQDDQIVSKAEHALSSELIHQSVKITDHLILDVNTATRSEQTLISMELYRIDQPDQPITSPSLMMANGKHAAIEIALDSGEILRLTFRYPQSLVE